MLHPTVQAHTLALNGGRYYSQNAKLLSNLDFCKANLVPSTLWSTDYSEGA